MTKQQKPHRFKTVMALGLSFMLSIASTSHADDIDVLGQFLDQNYSAQQDPLGRLAESFSDNDAAAAFNNLQLSSQSALILNSRTGEILYQKNVHSVRSIASISKLVSAMVILDSNPNMNEMITITDAEIDRLKGTSSRLSVGTTLTRGELFHIGLMSSENRAIHAMARSYPGGLSAFINQMNQKVASLGMSQTKFYDPTGLDPRNVSTANDLALLVKYAKNYPQIKYHSTAQSGSVVTSRGKTEKYGNSNMLVREGTWNIDLQKTGYIRESGRSMVVSANIQGEPITIVLLNSPTSLTRANDARNIRSWMGQKSL